jgi:hypothetical protein
MTTTEGTTVSIIRVGLSETQRFGEGYDAIFARKKSAATPSAAKKKPGAKKKPAKKK